jgi:hypothetical protein
VPAEGIWGPSRMTSGDREAWIVERVAHLGLDPLPGRPTVFDDTTNYMYIDRGDVIDVGGELFLVRGHEKEGRFGIDDQPKFWVKRAILLADGQKHILKLTCRESFRIQVGTRQVVCSRSAEKEGQVLALVHGDSRFMQGHATRDARGNLVRTIRFIEGTDLLSHIAGLGMPHEEYFRDAFPSLLARTITAFEGIQFLNDHGLSHGDIRNDHILIERDTGAFRWIDFDLVEDFTLFDLWSLGNVLHCVVGKGFVTFRDAIDGRPDVGPSLSDDDGSVFFGYRVMNLRKVYPWVPAKLNDVLLRFSRGASICYDSISQVVQDLRECEASL